MPPLNSPTNDEKINATKLSALKNAARISHLIEEATIGPKCAVVTPKHISASDALRRDVLSNAAPNNLSTNDSNKWKKDVWRSVKTEDEVFTPKPSPISLNDCKAVSFRLAFNSAEKQRRAMVRKQMLERQRQYDELSIAMEQMKLNHSKQVELKVKKDLLLKEQEILEAVKKYEESAKHTEELTKQEMIAHDRRIVERTNQLKRNEELRGHFEAIKSFKNLFIIGFEKYVKTILQNQQYTQGNAENYQRKQESFLHRYENLIKHVNSGHISANEVSILEKVCDDIREAQRQVDEEIIQNSEELDRIMLADKAEALRKQQEEIQSRTNQFEEQQRTQQSKPDQVDAAAPPPSLLQCTAMINPSVIHNFINPNRLQHYQQVMAFYEDYAKNVKPLQADDNMKKYRFNLQKAVNIPLNSISAVSPQHLMDKFNRLSQLLTGAIVKVGDVKISTKEHPLGVKFCTLLIANKLVNQADSIISSNPQAAFPIASVVIAIWQSFPDVGQLFLAYLYKGCPYLVPYFIPQLEGQTTEVYLKLLGYRYSDGVLEKQDLYLKRMTGLIRLYSSILITPCRASSNQTHPHGLENGWIWLTSILNLEPLPDICATLIQEFIVTVGAQMWRTFGQQFLKLLVVIYQQYMMKLNKVDEGGPKARLEVLLGKIIKEQKISPPNGVLSANFW